MKEIICNVCGKETFLKAYDTMGQYAVSYPVTNCCNSGLFTYKSYSNYQEFNNTFRRLEEKTMGNNVTFLIGPPCSGKSTYAKESGLPVVSRDIMREMIGYDMAKGFDPRKEELITKMCETTMDLYIHRGMDFIVDNLNLRKKNVFPIMKFINDRTSSYIPQFVKFNEDLEELLLRNENRRTLTGKYIPSDVIEKNHNLCGKRKIDEYYEWWNDSRQGHIVDGNNMVPYNHNKDDCVIFDIDGTLAHKDGREWYEFSKVGTDILDKTVAEVLGMYHSNDYYIVIVSGRSDICREQTEKWLRDKGVPYDELYMRKEGDHRQDSVVKEEILHTLILPEFNVIASYDDRNQVVNMWRRNGIKCFQVAEGNF